MPLSTDVRLSVNVQPRFPKRCIVCSQQRPDQTIGVGDLAVGWFSFFTDIPEGWGSVSVPIHAGCRRPFRTRRWLTRLGYVAAVLFLYWLLGEQLESLLPTGLRRIGLKVAFIVLLLPLIVMEMLHPARFDITVSKYHVDFEFADPVYAAAFAKLNNEVRRYEEIATALGRRAD